MVERHGAPPSVARNWFVLLRPTHWAKNLFVLAPLLFSGRATESAAVLAAVLAFVAFCIAASAVYCFNDVLDVDADRAHPIKRRRPVASGAVHRTHAVLAACLLSVVAIGLAAAVNARTLAWLGLYLGVNILYSVWLKRIVLLDVFAIASFFVIRLLVGSAAVQVHPSVWLLMCGGLLALYLGFAKRRHELAVLGESSSSHRGVLADYSAPFLDQLSAVLLAVTVVSYLMYTLTSDTAARVGSDELSYGVPFVLYGVFRYLFLVHKRDLGTPTETVLADRPLLVTVVLWGAYNVWVLYRPQ